MGNCLGCSDSGKRLLTAATDGDVAEARKLLEVKPGLSKYTTFGRLSSPLHVAAAGGHSEIVMMLLEYGADVNSRNFYGHTPLMEACNNGCWEVVQVLLLFKCNVSKVEYLSGWTALHFAAQSGHIPCIRLLATDFAPGVPHGATDSPKGETERDLPNSSLSDSNDRQALSRFINKTAKCGITALHLAAVNGNADCVHLLLDLHADVSATGLYHSSSVASIGAGSTPLHYAAYSGNLKCCQVLLARGASRSAVNCHGWLPVDVARIWGCHELVPILSPKSNPTLPVFPPNCLSLPLISILKIAREYGLNSSTVPSDESDLCAVCLESACTVAAEGCGHGLCTRCAFCLCSTSNIKSEVSAPPGSIPCPLCREGIVAFARLQTLPAKDQIKLDGETQTRLDDKCNSDLHSQNPSAAARRSQLYKNQSAVVPSEAIGMIICPTHLPNRCQSAEHEGIRPVVDRTAPEDMEKIIEQRTSCSTSFQNGRLCAIC